MALRVILAKYAGKGGDCAEFTVIEAGGADLRDETLDRLVDSFELREISSDFDKISCDSRDSLRFCLSFRF